VSASTLSAAQGYARLGWRVVPVPSGEKAARCKGWPDLIIKPEDLPRYFGNGGNIAIRVGSSSGNLIDVDLDCFGAIILADIYLPVTGAQFGRSSKPRSHRLFIAPGARFESFADPITGEMLVELRADGQTGGAHLTTVPPSTADGERREWYGDTITPAAVDARILRRRVVLLAMACLVRHYISESASERPAPDFPRLLWEFDHELGRAAYRWLGQPDPDAPRRYPRHRDELSQRDLDLIELVRAIPNNCSWDEWNRIGMAVYAASDGSGDGWVAFDAFSAKSAKYNPRTVRERWLNYRRSPPLRIGMGTLVHLARQAGWTFTDKAAS
jgi:hypothetical protein